MEREDALGVSFLQQLQSYELARTTGERLIFYAALRLATDHSAALIASLSSISLVLLSAGALFAMAVVMYVSKRFQDAIAADERWRDLRMASRLFELFASFCKDYATALVTFVALYAFVNRINQTLEFLQIAITVQIVFILTVVITFFSWYLSPSTPPVQRPVFDDLV